MFLDNNLTITIVNTKYNQRENLLKIDWNSEGADNIDYYVLQLNSDPSMLLKNTSAQVFISPSPKENTVHRYVLTLDCLLGCNNNIYSPLDGVRISASCQAFIFALAFAALSFLFI